MNRMIELCGTKLNFWTIKLILDELREGVALNILQMSCNWTLKNRQKIKSVKNNILTKVQISRLIVDTQNTMTVQNKCTSYTFLMAY